MSLPAILIIGCFVAGVALLILALCLAAAAANADKTARTWADLEDLYDQPAREPKRTMR